MRRVFLKVAPSSCNSDLKAAPVSDWTPLHRWHDPAFYERDVEVWIKRDDLADPWTGGNKRRKLLHLLQPDRLACKEGIYSFGGPFSNHLTAVAAMAARMGLPSHGFIRSWKPLDNPLLRQWRTWGMKLTFLAPRTFEEYGTSPIPGLETWQGIPMGGAHPLALEGTADIVREIRTQTRGRVTHIAVPAGTGATAAGMAGALHAREILLVYPALRIPNGRAWLEARMEDWGVRSCGSVVVDELAPAVRFGRPDPGLWRWLGETAVASGVLFDPLYNGPMARRLLHGIRDGMLPGGSVLVLVHSGGQAGRMGYQWRHQLPRLATESLVDW